MRSHSCLMFSSVSLNCSNIFLAFLYLSIQQKTTPVKMARLISSRQVRPTPQQNQMLLEERLRFIAVCSSRTPGLLFSITKYDSRQSYSLSDILSVMFSVLHPEYRQHQGRSEKSSSSNQLQFSSQGMLPSNTQLWQQFCPPSSWQVKYRISQGMTSPAELICSSASSSLSLRYSSAVVVSCSDRWTRLLAQTVRVSLALQTNFWAVLPATKQKRSWRVRVIEMSQSERFIIYIVQMNENQSIGMMEGAFFVPKSDLLAWVNSTLQLEVKQIEQLGTGAIYCQLIDAMYPGKIAMARVNWRARNEWEFISNFKVLQQGFGKCKIQKYIDIEKLSKGKYQDNLEFVQWLKRYFDLHNKNDLSNYDATTARKNAQVDLSFVDIRNPLKARQKDQNESNQNLRKARSPYDNVKSKLNNRSLSLARPKHQSEYFIDKLSQIKHILKNAKKEEKLARIEQILESVEELPRKEETMGDLQKSESKNVLGKEDSKKGGEKDDDPKKAVVKRRKGKD